MELDLETRADNTAHISVPGEWQSDCMASLGCCRWGSADTWALHRGRGQSFNSSTKRATNMACASRITNVTGECPTGEVSTIRTSSACGHILMSLFLPPPPHRHYCSTKVHRLRAGAKLTHNDGKHGQNTGNSGSRGKNAKAAQRKGSKKQKPNAAAQSAAAKGQGNTFTRKTIKAAEVNDNR